MQIFSFLMLSHTFTSSLLLSTIIVTKIDANVSNVTLVNGLVYFNFNHVEMHCIEFQA